MSMTRRVSISVLAFILATRCGAAPLAQRPDENIKAWVAEATAVARSAYDVELVVDSRYIEGVSSILHRLRDQNAHRPIEADSLRQEVIRWGAVLGEIQRSHWSSARWGRCKERNLAYSYSVYVPLEGGGRLESNEFDLAEGLITKPMQPELTIQQVLTLHFLD